MMDDAWNSLSRLPYDTTIVARVPPVVACRISDSKL